MERLFVTLGISLLGHVLPKADSERILKDDSRAHGLSERCSQETGQAEAAGRKEKSRAKVGVKQSSCKAEGTPGGELQLRAVTAGARDLGSHPLQSLAEACVYVCLSMGAPVCVYGRTHVRVNAGTWSLPAYGQSRSRSPWMVLRI